MDLLGILAAVLVAGVLLFAALIFRRRAIGRRGVFDCSLRDRPGPRGKGWMLGLARYADDTLEWYRMFSLAPRPRRTLCRRGLVVLHRRAPSTVESYALLPGAVVIECAADGKRVELAMGEEALTGFRSWLEAAPPGRDVNVA